MPDLADVRMIMTWFGRQLERLPLRHRFVADSKMWALPAVIGILGAAGCSHTQTTAVATPVVAAATQPVAAATKSPVAATSPVVPTPQSLMPQAAPNSLDIPKWARGA